VQLLAVQETAVTTRHDRHYLHNNRAEHDVQLLAVQETAVTTRHDRHYLHNNRAEHDVQLLAVQETAVTTRHDRHWHAIYRCRSPYSFLVLMCNEIDIYR